MAVKVEMHKDKGTIALAFECSRAEDHEILDAIRTMIFGDHLKQGGYVNSNRFVVKAKVEEET